MKDFQEINSPQAWMGVLVIDGCDREAQAVPSLSLLAQAVPSLWLRPAYRTTPTSSKALAYCHSHTRVIYTLQK